MLRRRTPQFCPWTSRAAVFTECTRDRPVISATRYVKSSGFTPHQSCLTREVPAHLHPPWRRWLRCAFLGVLSWIRGRRRALPAPSRRTRSYWSFAGEALCGIGLHQDSRCVAEAEGAGFVSLGLEDDVLGGGFAVGRRSSSPHGLRGPSACAMMEPRRLGLRSFEDRRNQFWPGDCG